MSIAAPSAGDESPRADSLNARDGFRDTLLLYIHVPLQSDGAALYIEAQACNGLRLWAANFPRLIVMAPLRPDPPSDRQRPVTSIEGVERIEFHPLPWAYRPDLFLRTFGRTWREIRGCIKRADLLVFGIGGLFGDWGSVAAIAASHMGRPYAVWTDRVESEVMRRTAGRPVTRARIRAELYWRPMRSLERWVISGASLGLFHGRDTYETFAPWCRRSELVHDIHVGPEAHLDAAAVATKQAHVREGPLNVIYAGRADDMKGPLDWLDVLNKLDARGVPFKASWIGDGIRLDAMRARAAECGLGDRVEFPGYIGDREDIAARLREAHVLMFCHKTPESPRILIEALIAGTPLFGYESSYARDLISAHGGGVLTPLNDSSALAEAVAAAAADRSGLADLVRRAVQDAAPHNDQEAFRHRSDLIKEYFHSAALASGRL